MLAVGLKACRRRRHRQEGCPFRTAIEKATIASPRGDFTLSKAHNPVQDIYLRKVDGKENKKISVAVRLWRTQPAAAACNRREPYRLSIPACSVLPHLRCRLRPEHLNRANRRFAGLYTPLCSLLLQQGLPWISPLFWCSV